MPFRIILDDREAVQRLARINGRFAKFGPDVINRIVALFRASMRQQFETEGDWGGKKWAPLARVTLERKAALGFGNKLILERTGKLREAFTELSSDFDVTTEGTSIVITISNTAGKYHQDGTPTMPKREIIPDPLPATFVRQLKNIVTGYMLGADFQ